MNENNIGGERLRPSAAALPTPVLAPPVSQDWAARLDLSNFVNAYYQYRDVQSLHDCKTVLIVGPGQGLPTVVLKWRGYEVTTLDIEPSLAPDDVGSVHDLSRYEPGQFDVLIASHVLEHLPASYLDQALAQIARAARYALIYLPVHGVYGQVRLSSNFRDFDQALLLTLSNWFEQPDEDTPRYMSGQHYWEIGLKGFRVRDMLIRMKSHFQVLRTYRNKDWLPSHNFVLKSLSIR
jgi:hypothetical protein